MNKNEFESTKKIIRETFHDTRCIKGPAPEHMTMLDENVHQGGFILITEDGEFIDFEIQLKDFDEVELAKFIEFAENLYEKHEKKVSIYLLCPKDINVSVRECPIKSPADFRIRLACTQENPCYMILDSIKHKILNKKILTSDDISMLENLPNMCNKKDRTYFRVETLRILNGHFP
nr:hypothetical protein [uncultured Methanobrevibacter sp.]